MEIVDKFIISLRAMLKLFRVQKTNQEVCLEVDCEQIYLHKDKLVKNKQWES